MTISPLPQLSPAELLQKVLDKALSAQAPLAEANVERLCRVHPAMTPQELLKSLDRAYLTAVTLSGCGAGAAGAVPGVAVGLTAALADFAAFTEATVLYVLSAAEVHGLHPEDVERRRALVLAVMIGDSAVGAVRATAGRTAPHWAKQIVHAIPMDAINRLNKVLGPRFITKYGTKQGVLVLGKQLPIGLGVVIGGGGNYLIGCGIVASTRKTLGDLEDAA